MSVHHEPFAYVCPRCERETETRVTPPERCRHCGYTKFLLTDADRAFLKQRAVRLQRERLLQQIEAAE